MSSQRVALNDAAVPMTCGNAVAPGNAPPNLTPGPVSDTPWSASDHHSYPATPSRGTPAALFTSSRTFSARVSRATRSRARARAGSDRLQNGSVAAGPPAAHANADRAATGTTPPPTAAPASTRSGRSRRRRIVEVNSSSATARCLWKWRWRRQRAYIN
ncbi:Os11g0673400, partial [Oryza sativa Japonica Group]